MLRPGRLDKSILCELPSVEERFEIMQCLSSTMKLASSVDLKDLAIRCDGYTGADISSVFSNAQLEAIHDATESSQKMGNIVEKSPKVPIEVVSGFPSKSDLLSLSTRVIFD